ncbi:MAG TPA: hypothetical protein VGQ41_21435 [Pyrinomonadaceae bacterium]|nr:hypothetical protein [Pyrinomonadaceae bacterium]
MSDEYKQQSQGGEYNQQKQEYKPPPPPPPPPCPDPCDEKPHWGPPEIRPECCTHHPCCPEHEKHCCTWESVDDPCVKAASCDPRWTKVTCKCESLNKCDYEEWDCSSYPQGTCVPCKPCEGLIPDPEDPGGCNDPDRDNCTSEDLRKQLDALSQCISSQQSAKAKLEADIKARNERATALTELIGKFDGIIKDYKDQRHKLICREDCLKGFHRDITAVFSKYSDDYLRELRNYINEQLCLLEKAKCCQKNLDGKLSKLTKLIWEQQEAEKEKQKADKAFEIIKDLPKWLDDKFKELEGLKEQIAQALNDVDPQNHKWGFYLFYWKFVPKLCRCFPFPFCCEDKDEYGEGGKPGYEQGSQKQNHPQPEKPANHLGCKPGDWHPSAITDEKLRALICCAWDYARNKKQNLQDAIDRVADVTNNLNFIKTKVEADEKSLDDRIKSGLSRVGKSAPTSR